MRTAACLCLPLALAACAKPTALPAPGSAAGAPAAPAPSAAAKPSVAHDVVESAAGAFVGQRVDGGELLPPETLLDELSRADLVCIGEEHGQPRSHWAEWLVLSELAERSAMSGRTLGLGLEMLPRTEQRNLDRYSSFELEEPEFLHETRWSERWGWDFAYYRSQLELARHRGMPLLSLNAPREITRAVARGGLAALSPQQHKQIPEPYLGDASHRAWFEQATGAHGHGKPEHLYAAQVVWDETMAESAVRWLGSRLPGRQLVVLAGNGHCRADAIPARVRRRIPAEVVSVRVAGSEAASAGEWDYLLVFE